MKGVETKMKIYNVAISSLTHPSSRAYLSIAKTLPNVKIVAIADKDRKKLVETSNRFRVKNIYTEYEEMLKKHPEIVAKFVYALNKAVEFIKSHPHEAAVIVAKHLATSSDIMEESMKYLDYTLKINKTALEEYSELLQRYGAIDHEINLDDFIYIGILSDLGIK